MKKRFAAVSLAISLMGAAAGSARAHGTASEASALSMLPVAVSVAAPVALLSVGAVLTVVAVEAAATGTGWVLSAAGLAIAYIPNELGKALLYNERVTR